MNCAFKGTTLDSVDIKAQSLIDKYLKCRETLKILTLNEFVTII